MKCKAVVKFGMEFIKAYGIFYKLLWLDYLEIIEIIMED